MRLIYFILAVFFVCVVVTVTSLSRQHTERGLVKKEEQKEEFIGVYETMDNGVPVGLAFFYNADGDMFTSKKLLETCLPDTLRIRTSEGDWHDAEVIAVSAKHDLAALATHCKRESFGSIEVSDSRHVVLHGNGADVFSASYCVDFRMNVEKKIGWGSINVPPPVSSTVVRSNMSLYPLSSGGVALGINGLVLGVIPYLSTEGRADHPKSCNESEMTIDLENAQAIVDFSNTHKLKIVSWTPEKDMTQAGALLHAANITGALFCVLQ